jgi:chemosensory pili system protein ChpA (sensor histidine kinase/response regulator)
MDSPRNPATTEASTDLSALAWVQEELRRSLENAHKALRRHVKESDALGESDVDIVDPSVLRGARAQFHQGVGALELVGLPEAATVLRASESAIQRYVSKPHKLTPLLVEDIEKASFALLDYLSRMLSGKPVSALAMFPQYRAVQEAVGADRIHPADLWSVDWRWRELPTDARVPARRPDNATRSAIESQLLNVMRGAQPQATFMRMSDICAGLGAGATQPQASTLWKLAAAVFEALSHGLLGLDVFSKRVASRLLAQFRVLERGDHEVSERLAQDLLFFCAQSASPGDGRQAPRLAAVRQAYELSHELPTDYTAAMLGRFDPAWIAQARKRVAAAKESWSGVAGGELHRLSGLTEQFSLLADSLRRLFPMGDALGIELQQAVIQTQQAGAAPALPMAMEAATSLLYVEAALEDGEFDHPDQAKRVTRLAERLSAVRRGAAPEPLEPWMEELYRRVSDRQTMGSVVQELRGSLSEAEKLIDEFFRNPLDRRVLIPVPNQLSAMRGVLSVLGMDQASAALLRMRDEVDGLASTVVEPERVQQAGVFDRLASNLGALGFLIDMLNVQPTLAKSLFVYDAQAGTLSPVMGRVEPLPGAVAAAPRPPAPRLIEQAQSLAATAARDDVSVERVARDLELLSHEAQAADQPALAATVRAAQRALTQAADAQALSQARGLLAEKLADFVISATEPIGLDVLPAKAPPAVAAVGPITLQPGAPSTNEDDEMRGIFLEEAREVVADAQAAHAQLTQAPSDLSLLTTLRRAFHTLKGSSRMVGLKEFGEAAWACEQIYNSQLAEQRAAEGPLLDFTGRALGELSQWVEAIAADRAGALDASSIRAAANALSGRGDTAAPAPAPRAAAAAAPIPAPAPAPAPLPPIAAVAAPVEPGPRPAPAPAPAAAATTAPDLDDLPPLEISLLPVVGATPAGGVVDAPMPLPEVTFELDLGGLDAPPAAPSPGSPAMPLDSQVSAFNEPFDIIEPTEPMPLPEIEAPAAPGQALELIDLDLGAPPDAADARLPDLVAELPDAAALAQAAPFDLTPVPLPEQAPGDDDNVKVVGHLRIGIPLFNIYLNEADELSRRLTTEVAEWAMELHRPVGDAAISLAHSLAGSSATVGFTDLSQLARSLEHALMRTEAIGSGNAEEARLFVDAAEEVRRLLHQFAAGFLRTPSPELIARLAEHEVTSARRLEAATAASELEDDADELPVAAASAVDELLVLEPEPEAAPVAEPPVAVEAAAVTMPIADRAAEPSGADDVLTEPAPLADSTFGGEASRFDPLGLAELKPLAALPAELPRQPAVARVRTIEGEDEDIDAVDAVDAELFPIFEEEALELLPQLAGRIQEWSRRPSDPAPAAACMRTLHTLKGGARLAGAMRLGEMAHRMETRLEHVLAHPPATAADIDGLQVRSDALMHVFEALRSRDAQAYAEASAAAEALVVAAPVAAVVPPPPPPAVTPPAAVAVSPLPPKVDAPLAVPEPDAIESSSTAALEAEAPAERAAADAVVPAPAELSPIDWSGFALGPRAERAAPDRGQSGQAAVRVRTPLLDRLVNQAGEVSITRSRIESGVGQIKGSLADLTENLDRLRQQLRDIELQAETQMTSRLEAAKAASQNFDPLEFDRFTRFQELTRMMAESVNDVATVQRTLQRSLDSTEDELAAQARLTRDLQDDLLRTRMVEFEGLSDRLYRVVRLAAKETGKQVRLDIVGGSIEVDRGVLDRMTPAFEHLLRNCVGHGIEDAPRRTAAGKDSTGTITVALSQEGNEVGVEFRDDGRGLDLPRIRAKGLAMGLLEPQREYADVELANLIFTPGFSTADTVTELSGRGVGMDVVRSEVNAMGGRIETSTAPGQGTAFKLVLPLTTAVTQVVMLRCGDTNVAVPSTLIEIVRRATPAEVERSYASGAYVFGDRALPFFWLGALLQSSPRPMDSMARSRTVIVVRSAQQRIAIHVDEVLGNQEVVVKNLGPQLARLPGLAGMTLLASGVVALIYNPVALATLYGEAARAATAAAFAASSGAASVTPVVAADAPVQAPLVLVVDDSLTVRRVTQRLLVREGYRVVLAKDGLDALERLATEKPQVVLSDIEMPRMDGFDLVRNIRADQRLADLPVIMITSRIAQKHRDYAAQLGVDHYLGKPYSEEDLLALVGRYTAAHPSPVGSA